MNYTILAGICSHLSTKGLVTLTFGDQLWLAVGISVHPQRCWRRVEVRAFVQASRVFFPNLKLGKTSRALLSWLCTQLHCHVEAKERDTRTALTQD